MRHKPTTSVAAFCSIAIPSASVPPPPRCASWSYWGSLMEGGAQTNRRGFSADLGCNQRLCEFLFPFYGLPTVPISDPPRLQPGILLHIAAIF